MPKSPLLLRVDRDAACTAPCVLLLLDIDVFELVLRHLSTANVLQLSATSSQVLDWIAGSGSSWRPRCARFLATRLHGTPSLRRFEHECATLPSLQLYRTMARAARAERRAARFARESAPAPLEARVRASLRVRQEAVHVRRAVAKVIAVSCALLGLDTATLALGCAPAAAGTADGAADGGADDDGRDGGGRHRQDLALLALLVVVGDVMLLLALSCLWCRGVGGCRLADGACELTRRSAELRTVMVAWALGVLFSAAHLAQQLRIRNGAAACVPLPCVHAALLLALPLLPCNARAVRRLRAAAGTGTPAVAHQGPWRPLVATGVSLPLHVVT